MNNLLYKKKFQLNQIKKLDPIVELFLLEMVLETLAEDEKFELASIIFNRIESVKSTSDLDRSSPLNPLLIE